MRYPIGQPLHLRIISASKRYVLLLCYYYSVSAGLTSLRFDFKSQRIIKSRSLTFYAVCANIALIVSMPFALRAGLAYMRKFEQNELLQLTDAVNISIRFAVTVLTLIFRCRREHRYQEMADELLTIGVRYFDKHPLEASLEHRFDWIFFGKFLTAIGQGTTVVIGMMQMTRVANVEALALAMYFSNIQNILHAVMFHYFSALWYACRCFHILNVQLKQLLQTLERLHANGADILHQKSWTLQQLSRIAAADLSEMSQVHWRLTSLVQRLNDSYKYQTIAVLLTCLINNVTYGYYAVLVADGTMNAADNTTLSVLVGAVSYAILFADLYLFYWTCDATTCAYQRAAVLLRELQTLPLMDATFERHCEVFSLQLMQRKLCISMGGMFNLNMQSSLALWGYTLRHTLILVQFDYENRFRRFKASVAFEIDFAGDLI